MSPDEPLTGAEDGYPQDATGWPSEAECAGAKGYADSLAANKLEVRKKRAEAEIERAKALFDSEIASRAAEAEAERELRKTYYQSVFEVAKGSMDRARSAAELVQKAAGAIVTLYTAVLAVTFSVSDNRLPWQGVLPAFFLGLAIMLSAGFLAYLPEFKWEQEQPLPLTKGPGGWLPRLSARLHRTSPEDGLGQDRSPSGDSPGQEPFPKPLANEADRLAAQFILWSRAAATRRSGWLRASVISLGVALIFLPAPFLGGGKAQAQSDTPVTWPALAPQAPSDPELQKILYAAQVAEAAEERKAVDEQTTGGGSAFPDWAWGAAAIAGLVIVIGVPLIYPGEVASKRDAKNRPAPPKAPA